MRNEPPKAAMCEGCGRIFDNDGKQIEPTPGVRHRLIEIVDFFLCPGCKAVNGRQPTRAEIWAALKKPDWAAEIASLNAGGPTKTLRFYTLAMTAMLLDNGEKPVTVTQRALHEMFNRCGHGWAPELAFEKNDEGLTIRFK